MVFSFFFLENSWLFQEYKIQIYLNITKYKLQFHTEINYYEQTALPGVRGARSQTQWYWCPIPRPP